MGAPRNTTVKGETSAPKKVTKPVKSTSKPNTEGNAEPIATAVIVPVPKKQVNETTDQQAKASADAAAEQTTVPRKVTLVAGKVWTIPTPIPKDKIGWSDARRRYTIAYLGRLQMLMRLADWEITIDFDTAADEDTLAQVSPNEYQRRARIEFGTEFFTINGAEQRQTLIHEFLHLHLIHLDMTARDAAKALGGDEAHDAFSAPYNGEIERTTDAIADVLAPFVEPYELPSR